MKIKKSIVIEAMNKFVDLILDQIQEKCSCSSEGDDLEFKTKSGKEVTLLADKEKECETPGEKIRSKGKGKGKARGKGKGPIGNPTK